MTQPGLQKPWSQGTQLASGCRAERIASGLEALDKLLGGGLERARLCEWGLPAGKNGLRLVTQFLAAQKPLTLWIFSRDDAVVYPPAWAALGVDLSRVFFVKTSEPLRQLRPIFLEALFDLIVFDRPARLTPADCAFLAAKARSLRASILLLRPYELSTAWGNPHVRSRVNCCFDFSRKVYRVTALKGSEGQLRVELPAASIGCWG